MWTFEGLVIYFFSTSFIFNFFTQESLKWEKYGLLRFDTFDEISKWYSKQVLTYFDLFFCKKFIDLTFPQKNGGGG